jgi:hypothetical protein
VTTIFDYSALKGINNVDTQFRLITRGGVELLEAVNVDVTNRGTIKRRPHTQEIYSGSGIANLCSVENTIYFTEGLEVKTIDVEGNVNTVGSFDSISGKVTFAKCGGVVYASNGIEIKALDDFDEQNDFPHLERLPGGDIFSFAGRLFSCREKSILYSEPYNYLYYIPEKNYLSFPNEIISYKANGFVCVSTKSSVYIFTKDLTLIKILDEPAFPNSMVSIKSLQVKDQIIPVGILFETANGIYLATPNGCVPLNIKYARSYPSYSKAASDGSRMIVLTNS